MKFTKSFTDQAPLPQASLDAALEVLQSASLHRYQPMDSSACNPVAGLESEFAAWQGAKYCLAVTSGGQAMQLAMRTAGVRPGDSVLTNAFTLAPVPGAIHAVGATPVFVEMTQDLVIDLQDFAQKAANSGANCLLLSHMRGHLADMPALMAIAQSHRITVIEDCAHTMGATWAGTKSGNFGAFGCFSTQTYKHLNSGEGGFITTNDAAAVARAIVMSGSYMNYDRHQSVPQDHYFESARYQCPNLSARMDALRAAVLRPQLNTLDEAIAAWNHRYAVIADCLSRHQQLRIPEASALSQRVGSSMQFSLPAFGESDCLRFLEACRERQLDLKWFGRSEPMGFTSTHEHWRYVPPQSLPQTDRILATLFDFRIPLSFDDSDCRLLGSLLLECLDETLAGASS